LLAEQRLGQSGLTFLFNDAGHIVAHPEMGRLMDAMPERSNELPRLDAINLAGLSPAIRGVAQGRTCSADLCRSGGQDICRRLPSYRDRRARQYHLAVVRAARRILLHDHLGATSAVRDRFGIRSRNLAAGVLGRLADGAFAARAGETDRRNSEVSGCGAAAATIDSQEIDELGRSVFTMRTVVRNFSSFIPKQIVRQLIESGTSLGLGGTRREITVLFTDVADFTAKTEKADPSQVMIFTSRYFAGLSEAIMNHHGTIDKFIRRCGDGALERADR
jgi:adenylate cyclase